MASLGDVALVGYSADNGGKGFALLLLADLSGQVINITDNGWTAAGAFRANEGVFSLTVPTGLAAGAVLQVSGLGTASVVVTANGTTIPSSSYTISGSINPATGGDQFLVYQGSASSPTFLFAVDFADDNATYAGDAPNANTTAVPTGLTFGTNALAFGLDNASYTGTTTGTRGEILANIANSANWTQNDVTPQAYPSAFAVTGGGVPFLYINDPIVTEGNSGSTLLTYTVTSNTAAPAGGITFNIATADGSATLADSDYIGHTVIGASIAEGQNSYTFSVTVNGDTRAEGNETVLVNLSNPTNAAIADSQGVGTIVNDDPGLTISDPSVTEGNSGTSILSYTVTSSVPAPAGGITFNIATADGTATLAGGDYVGRTVIGASIAAGQTSYTFNVTVNGDTLGEPNETVLVNLSNATNAAILDAQGVGTIISDDLIPIYTIQGSPTTQGANGASPYTGQTVLTSGIITARDTNGYYIQDVAGDGNAATSDAVLVYTGTAPAANLTVGSIVQVTGIVAEFSSTSNGAGAPSVTEIVNSTATVIGTSALPAPVVIAALPNDLPGALAFFESLEGMRVTVPSPLVTGPTTTSGEIFTVANGGVGSGVTAHGNLLVTGGSVALGRTDTVGGDFQPDRLVITSGLGTTVPNDLNTGAVLNDVTGILGQGYGYAEIQATSPVTVQTASPLVKTGSSLFGDTTHLLVASYNAENLDPGDGAARFATIASEIINFLHAPGVIALQEVQDNNGATNDSVTGANVTLQTLVNAISAAGGPTYAYIDNTFISDDRNGGEPGGNIRVAYLYRTDTVALVPNSLRTIAANGNAITDTGTASGNAAANADQATNQNNPFFGSRPPLAAEFVFLSNGEHFTVVNNHFTSKGGSDFTTGTIQPPLNAGEVARAAQAQAVNTFVDNLLMGNANAKIIVTGDLNEYEFEEPLTILKGNATLPNYQGGGQGSATYVPGGTAVLTDLQDSLPANLRYDYVFDGVSQTLDHLLATTALTSAGYQFQPVHINAEFYNQTSDHDPLAALFTLTDATGYTFANANTGEGDSGTRPLTFTVTRDDASVARTLYAQPVSGTATAGSDFVAGVVPVTFAVGQTSATFTIPLIGDTVVEPTENFMVNLYNDAGLTLLRGSATGTIVNDDTPGTGGNDTVYSPGGQSPTLAGGDGNDTYVIVSGSEVIVDTSGYDIVYSPVSYALNGGAAIEVLSTQTQQGTDPINLIGNSFAQHVVGNFGDNVLNGNGGADTLIGLKGNDTYAIADANAVIVEQPGEGYDIVYTSVGYTLTATAAIEELSFTEQRGTANLNIIGNGFDQKVIGNFGNNVLNGNGGVDTLIGLKGDDIYSVGDARAVVLENGGEGNDTVYATVSYRLAAGQEIETLSTQTQGDTTALNMIGNEFGQKVIGNNGANLIDGGAGADTLIGLGGADTFSFSTALGNGNVDTIQDYQAGTDHIQLLSSVFSGLSAGTLASGAFVNGTTATAASAQVLYNQATGQLYFDADGTGSGAAVLFATVTPGTALSASDFQVTNTVPTP